MPQDDSRDDSLLPEAVRLRIASDLAAGRTVALPPSELARAEVREHLPALLEGLGQPAGAATSRLQVPGYTVLGEIGHGGMSTVYLANHLALGRYVALKIVPNWLGGQERARERLLNEARAMARLSHPNIVTIHDIVDHGDTVAIAMEWVDGLTLAGLLRALPDQPGADDMVILRTSLGTPLEAQDHLETTATRTFVRMMTAVARAVHHVHQHGLLHLDIKPSNVLVRRDGTPLLADFGVVREIDLALTHTRSFAGTPIYAAPEQLRRDDRSFGPGTDVYGLGITLYELLARCQPLRQEGLTKLLQDIQAGRIPALATRAQVPDDLANIVHKAISPEPARRYASAAALADDLQAFLDGRPVSARPLTRVERARRWVRAEPWKAAAAALLLATLAVTLGLGLKLRFEMPFATNAKQQVARATNAVLVQRAFQSLLLRQPAIETAQLPERLEAARRSDPDDPAVVACLLSLLHVTQPERLEPELRRAEADGHRSLGLDLLRQRALEHREFLTAEEARQLRASEHRLDSLLWILDRTLFAESAMSLETHEEVATCIHSPALLEDQSPLLQGLRAWTAGKTGNTPALLETTRVLQRSWPDDPNMQTWSIVTLLPRDRAAAQQAARAFVLQHPSDLLIRCLLANELIRDDQASAALLLLDGIGGAAATSQDVTLLRCLAMARLGQLDLAEANLPGPAGLNAEQTRLRLAVLERTDADTARRAYRQLLTEPRPQPGLLGQACEFAMRTDDDDLLEAVCRVALEKYPQRASFRWRLFHLLNDHKKVTEAYDLVQGHPMPHLYVDPLGPLFAPRLMERKEWDELLAFTDRWARYTNGEEYRIHYFRGIAESRVGRRDDARNSLNQHVLLGAQLDHKARSEAKGGARAKSKRYLEAILELAWLDIDPHLPTDRRDPRRAAEYLQHCQHGRAYLDEVCQQRPWLALVLAEVRHAEGHDDMAKVLLAAAEAKRNTPDATSPEDLGKRIDEARERFTREIR